MDSQAAEYKRQNTKSRQPAHLLAEIKEPLHKMQRPSLPKF